MSILQQETFQVEDINFEKVHFTPGETEEHHGKATADLTDYGPGKVDMEVEADKEGTFLSAKGRKDVTLSEIGIKSLGRYRKVEVAVGIDWMGEVTAESQLSLRMGELGLNNLGYNHEVPFTLQFSKDGFSAAGEGKALLDGLGETNFRVEIDNHDRLTAMAFSSVDIPILGKMELPFEIKPRKKELSAVEKWDTLSIAGVQLFTPHLTFTLKRGCFIFQGQGELRLGGFGGVLMTLSYTPFAGFTATGEKGDTKVSFGERGNIEIVTKNLRISTRKLAGLTFSPPDKVGLAAEAEASIRFKGTRIEAHSGAKQELSFDQRSGAVKVEAEAATHLIFGHVHVKADAKSSFSAAVSIKEIKISADAGVELNIAGHDCRFKSGSYVSIDPLAMGNGAVKSMKDIVGNLAGHAGDVIGKSITETGRAVTGIKDKISGLMTHNNEPE
ncbi:MAG: hypothetical protein GY765_31815 [bacterium]|nr:hypothetical protein [bacterium]